MTNPPIVFLDTETDGVHPDRKVWEVAMIRRDPDLRQRHVQFYVDIDLSTADPFGLKVGRFYERHPLGRHLSAAGSNDVATATSWEDRNWRAQVLSLPDAAMRVARWTHGAHIVGAVPNFDTEVLGNLLRAHGLTPTWHHHLIDVENLAVGFLNAEAQQEISLAPELPWKSDELGEALGVAPCSPEERHTALGDARWAMRIYDRITGGAE